MSKRQKFIITTALLALGILLIRYPYLQWRWRVLSFSILSGGLSLWALYDQDFSGIEWLTLLILPVMFASGMALVFPLLPNGLDTFLVWPISTDSGLLLSLGLKITFILLFTVGYYAILLTHNIYNVAAIRTIQLLRAAHSVGFMMILFTVLALTLVISSVHLSSFLNFLLVFAVSTPLILSALWSVNLEERIGKRLVFLIACLSLCLAQIAWAISFWPISASLFALSLTATFYALVGMGQYYLSEKLTAAAVREFLTVSVVVFILILLTTSWAG